MERLNEIVARHQTGQPSQTSLLLSEKNSISQQGGEISIYQGVLTDSVIVIELAKAKLAFPSLPIDFFKVLTERLKANNFTDERLRDAINNVIDTCPYPTPTIANFISFDKKVKLCTYEEMLKKTTEYGAEVWKLYKQIQLPDREKPVWVNVDDAKKFKL